MRASFFICNFNRIGFLYHNGGVLIIVAWVQPFEVNLASRTLLLGCDIDFSQNPSSRSFVYSPSLFSKALEPI